MNAGDREDLVDNPGIVLGEAARAHSAERIEQYRVIILAPGDIGGPPYRRRQRELLSESVRGSHQGVEQNPQADILHGSGFSAAAPCRGQRGLKLGDPLSQPTGFGLGLTGRGNRLVTYPLSGLHGILCVQLGPTDPVSGRSQPPAGILDLGPGHRQAVAQLVALNP